MKDNTVCSIAYVENFIKRLKLPPIAYTILTTKEDCQEFFIGHMNKNATRLDDLLEFRDNKRNRVAINVEGFKLLVSQVGVHQAVKDVFATNYESVEVKELMGMTFCLDKLFNELSIGVKIAN